MNMKETQQVMNDRIVTMWDEHGMRYTLTAKPIDGTLIYTGPPNEMISLYEYLGYRSPEKGIGERIHSKAKEVDATISHKEVSTAKYTGKILLYERGFLDMYYNAVVGVITVVEPIITPPIVVTTITPPIEYDPIDDDLPF
jgi:hypothetical protein